MRAACLGSGRAPFRGRPRTPSFLGRTHTHTLVTAAHTRGARRWHTRVHRTPRSHRASFATPPQKLHNFTHALHTAGSTGTHAHGSRWGQTARAHPERAACCVQCPARMDCRPAALQAEQKRTRRGRCRDVKNSGRAKPSRATRHKNVPSILVGSKSQTHTRQQRHEKRLNGKQFF